ncbi:transposase family protein [Streptomyces zaomyceticus]|uniref:transposase family protein n=1 Tax=Streptomyces zaomyceticus TaxID=68286 RepID=UPI0037237E92
MGASCPGCGVWSAKVHGFYLRFPAGVPSAGRRVVLQVRFRRFACRNVECGRRTFVEQLPGLTRRNGQRTERLRSTLAAVGLALAGRAGARLAAIVGGTVSRGRASPPHSSRRETESPSSSRPASNSTRSSSPRRDGPAVDAPARQTTRAKHLSSPRGGSARSGRRTSVPTPVATLSAALERSCECVSQSGAVGRHGCDGEDECERYGWSENRA